MLKTELTEYKDHEIIFVLNRKNAYDMIWYDMIWYAFIHMRPLHGPCAITIDCAA